MKEYLSLRYKTLTQKFTKYDLLELLAVDESKIEGIELSAVSLLVRFGKAATSSIPSSGNSCLIDLLINRFNDSNLSSCTL